MNNIIIKIGSRIFLFLFLSSNFITAAEYHLSPASKVTFEYQNVIGVETYYWGESLLTYPVHFTGNIAKEDLHLIDITTGKKIVFQLSNVQSADGLLVAAHLSFLAALPQEGSFQYELSVAKGENNVPAENLKITKLANGLEIAGEKIQIRLPGSAQAGVHEAPAPVIAMNQGAAWIGDHKIISPTKKILSIQSNTLEEGPLFVEQAVSYRFEGGAEYTAKIKLVKNYPFVILDETINGLTEADRVALDMQWSGFHPAKRFGSQWDRNMESNDIWLDIDKPVYTSYCKEDPHWTGMGWIEDPAKQMLFRISPFGGNSVREQVPVMSFWENTDNARELGVFVYDNKRWNDKQYGVWQPTPLLSVYFRYSEGQLFFRYPLISGTRSTALSFFAEKEGIAAVDHFKSRLAKLAKRGGKNDPEELYFRYSQLLLMQYASLSLDKIKDWQLTYPETAKRPENPFKNTSGTTVEKFLDDLYTSPMAYYPLGLNGFPGVHSIEHRPLYATYIEDYLRFYKVLTLQQRQSVEALFILGGYVNTLEEMNAIRNSLAGTANMAADGWSVPPQIAFIMPEHPMAKEWMDFFEKTLEIYGLFYTRPDVQLYESKGGRWSESLGIYNWAFLRPTSHSNIAGESFDGKNRFASSYMAARGRWLRDMLTAPIEKQGRNFPPHGAHGGGYLVPRYTPMYQIARWLENYDPLLTENLFWTGREDTDVEKKPSDTDWYALYKKIHPGISTGTNPHLKSTKYTGHGIVLRAGVDTPEELSIHLDQVDKGPNYRWGNQGEGNSGGLYFYAAGKVYTGHENEIAGDHVVNNLDGLTNFGVMKGGDYRTIGMNELKAPLYDFDFAQFAEVLSDDGKDKQSWPEYLSRSVMLAGTDYFILFDEVGTNWRAAGRFALFNTNGQDFPKITFLSPSARKDAWMTAQTPNAHGFYRDNNGSVLTLVTHKKEEVFAEGGKPVIIPMLNDANISDFVKDKKNDLPTGAVRIKTAQSNDVIFRNSYAIHYTGEKESFDGKAGLIRRFSDGHLEISLFKGESIAADGLTVSLQPEKEAAVALARDKNGELNGKLKSNAPVSLQIGGLTPGGKLFANGVELKTQPANGILNITFQPGEYQLEYTPGKPYPMESHVLCTEYEKSRVKVFVESAGPAESVRMELSYDGGKTWQKKGLASKGVFYLPKEKVEKVHVRAVSVNGAKAAKSAPEYPIYFTNKAPHFPEGLFLKLDQNQVDLSWGEVLGVQKYRLYRRVQSENKFQLIYEGKSRSFTDTKAIGVQKATVYPGTLDNRQADTTGLIIYEYAVTAVTGNGESLTGYPENTNPSSWKNWYPDTELKFKRQSAFWMQPYVYPDMEPEKYYPE